jgi:plastocyanin
VYTGARYHLSGTIPNGGADIDSPRATIALGIALVAILVFAGVQFVRSSGESAGPRGQRNLAAQSTRPPARPTLTRTPAPEEKDPVPVTMLAADFAFFPADLSLHVGDPVTLTLVNNGTVEHNWRPRAMQQQILVDAAPGESASVTFTPETIGQFEFFCTLYENQGMQGVLTVYP